ncbi:MAG: hypothetical protein FK733_19375 [Asgard group archaeon]|nr:hypothetical protein [Asgard group archaeon]
MKYLRRIRFYSTIMLLSLLFPYYFVNSTKCICNDPIVPDTKNYHILELNDFKRFVRVSNDDSIISYRLDDYISFDVDDMPEYGSDYEIYALKMNAYGPVSDFTIRAEFEYECSDIANRFSFCVGAGSHYRENGEYLGYISYHYNYLCTLGISDHSYDFTGYHEIITYPYNVRHYTNNFHDSIGFTGNIANFAERTNGVLHCQVLDPLTQEIFINKTLTMGVSREVNFFSVYLGSVNRGESMSVTATDIQISATYFTTKTEEISYISYHLAIPFVVFFYALWYVFSNRKKLES